MEKGLQILEQGPKVEILLNSQKALLKKYRTGHLQALLAYIDFGLKNHIQPRQTGYRNE